MIVEPKSDKEWEAYDYCRWLTLRKPWGQPKGSESLPDDDVVHHAMYVKNNEVLGVIRLHWVEDNTFQIRAMGVLESSRNKGIGRKLVSYMENLARSKNADKIILHARDYAIPFYEKVGYKIVEKSYLLFDEIQHYKMMKTLS